MDNSQSHAKAGLQYMPYAAILHSASHSFAALKLCLARKGGGGGDGVFGAGS